jgi:hypothetical protein
MSSCCSFTDAPQIIEGQYLDQQKLMRLLKHVYGASDEGQNRFRVEVRFQHDHVASIQ